MALLQRTACPDDPDLMLEQTLCVSALSKVFGGELTEPTAEFRKCDTLECQSLTTVQRFGGKLEPYRCDEDPAKLGGWFEVSDLVHVFGDDGARRGFHSGDFRWMIDDTVVVGRLSGITHAGTHHPPVLECQECEAPGFLQGTLCGKVLRSPDRNYRQAQFIANYVFRAEKVDRETGLVRQGVVGTLEGVLVRGCGCC